MVSEKVAIHSRVPDTSRAFVFTRKGSKRRSGSRGIVAATTWLKTRIRQFDRRGRAQELPGFIANHIRTANVIQPSTGQRRNALNSLRKRVVGYCRAAIRNIV